MVSSSRDPVRWVVTLFVATFVLQRLSLPGLSIPVTIPFTLGWLGLALGAKVVAVDVRRLMLWMVASAASALVVVPQLLLVDAPYISVNSWALWIVVWLPLVVHVRDRSSLTYQRCLRGVAGVGLGLATLALLFVVLQLGGLPYRDWLGELVPADLLVQGYNSSYPISYGSDLYKSNAWLALEPSFLSFMLGICIVCAILVRVHPARLILLVAGMVATTAGSGFAVVGVAVLALVATGRASILRPYLLPGGVLGAIAAATAFGESILARTGELTDNQSSTALRAIEPYRYLWPEWVNDPAAVLLGRGAGSSRWVLDNLGIPGLLTPNVGKLLFDYGLLAGSLLVVLMVSAYLRSPEPVIALSLGVSMLTVQAASQPLVACSIALVALWSPRAALAWPGRTPVPAQRAAERLRQA